MRVSSRGNGVCTPSGTDPGRARGGALRPRVDSGSGREVDGRSNPGLADRDRSATDRGRVRRAAAGGAAGAKETLLPLSSGSRAVAAAISSGVAMTKEAWKRCSK